MPKQFSGNVLITGGSGFLGSRLVNLFLEKKCKVRVLDVGTGLLEGRKDPGLEFVGKESDGGMLNKDLVDKAMEGIDVVCHLAIDWGRSLSIGDLLEINAKGMVNLLDSAKAHGVKHFLYTSSVVVYGMSKVPRVDEESICRPEAWNRDPGPNYSVMKLSLEKFALLYNNYQSLPSSVLRIAVAFDDNKALRTGRDLSQKVLKGEPVQVARGVGRTSIHAEDVARAFYLAAMNEKAYGQVFNVSNPAAFITDLDVARVLIDATHSKSKIKIAPKPKTSPPIESISKAANILGWKPQKGKDALRKSMVNTIINMRSQANNA